MSILFLLLLLLIGLVGPSDIVADGPASAPVEIETVEAAVPAAPAAAAAAWPVAGVFVGVEEVEAVLGDRTTTIVALTPEDDYVAGHIPGAIQIDWKPFEIVETGDQAVASWQADVEGILTGLGIAPTDTVVVYDGGTLYAPRLWWVLDQLGHEDKLILDGGFSAWQAAGMPVDGGPGPEMIGDPPVPYVGTPNDAAIETIAEVEAALDDPTAVLIDARTPEEYAAGHIPGAVNIPFTDNAGPDGRWKSPDELREMYAAAGVTEDKTIIPYCLTGVRSATTYATLIALGYSDVSLFTGSWAEWSADPSRPIEV